MRMIRTKYYYSFFDEANGNYMRTGVVKDDVDTDAEPFMGEFPELLDVGIMGHCNHGRSGLCERSGVQCYQNGRIADSPNMPVRDFARIARECRGRTYQIALGGCGDPDQHEDFEGILRICRSNGIVPNFTTSGFGMTAKSAEICRRFCGAVAVSWYRNDYTFNAIRMLVEYGVRTNIHYVLNTDTVREAVSRLRESSAGGSNGFPEGINAVIFLLHKPVGQGNRDKMLTGDNEDFRELLSLLDKDEAREIPFKIGFDSCSVPALLHTKSIDPVSVDTCEGGRWSAYISPDMQMMPCSFAHEMPVWSVSLWEHTMQEAWDSEAFEYFRSRLRSGCPECKKRELCMGGCPIHPAIVLCGERHTYYGML